MSQPYFATALKFQNLLLLPLQFSFMMFQLFHIIDIQDNLYEFNNSPTQILTHDWKKKSFIRIEGVYMKLGWLNLFFHFTWCPAEKEHKHVQRHTLLKFHNTRPLTIGKFWGEKRRTAFNMCCSSYKYSIPLFRYSAPHTAILPRVCFYSQDKWRIQILNGLNWP